MTAKKGCLLLTAAGVVVVALIVVLVFWLTSGAVSSAEKFLALAAKRDIQAAYQSTSAQFRAQTTEEEFSAFVDYLGLDRFASASWTSRNVQNNEANLEGSFQTTDGATVPLKMTLVKESGDWRVLFISGPSAGAATTPSSRPLPSDEELKRLVGQTLTDFAAAVDSGGDFQGFHGVISNLWRSQITADGLRAAFAPLIDQEVDLGAAGGEAVFSEVPSVDDNGVLFLKGYSTSADSPNLNFELKYIYEHPAWKLFGIQVSVEQAVEEAAEQNAAPASPAETPGAGEPIAPAEAVYLVQENPELKGRLGRLVTEFPAGSKTSGAKIVAYRSGEDEPAVSSYGEIHADLLPGRYDVEVSGRRVQEVEIVSARDTRLLVGVLRVQVGSGTKVVIHVRGDDGGWTPVASGYGPTDFGLPVGNYGVEIAGQIEEVTVSADTISEF